MELVAQPLCSHGDGFIKKMLVESKGELLLDIYQSTYRFSVDFFKLDEKEKNSVKLMDFDKKWRRRSRGILGKGFLLGDLCLPKGNCVIFIDYIVLPIDDMQHGNLIFSLGTISAFACI